MKRAREKGLGGLIVGGASRRVGVIARVSALIRWEKHPFQCVITHTHTLLVCI